MQHHSSATLNRLLNCALGWPIEPDMVAPANTTVDGHMVKASRAIETQIGLVLLGKHEQVRIATASLLSGEHLLLNDHPGVGKTTLGLALSRVIDGSFGRIQGTPDLLPSDLSGITMFDQQSSNWIFRPGPLLNNIVLVDELSRITPRTQSALLEAMAERHITLDGDTHSLPNPFMVVATMNPVGSSGTYAPTTGQLDRFGASLSLGSPDREAERRILQGDGGHDHLRFVAPVVGAKVLPEFQQTIGQTYVGTELVDYALDICDSLRSDFHLSARAPKSMLVMARAMAVLEGRCFVVPEDIKRLAPACLTHRLASEGQPLDVHHDRVVDAVASVAVPPLST